MNRFCGERNAVSRHFGTRGVLIAVSVVIAMVLVLLVSAGCACKKTETKSGTILVNNVPVSAISLMRGDSVEVIGEENGYYKLRYSGKSGSVTENGKGTSTLLVEKGLVRLDSEAAPEEIKAYSKEGCQLFDNPYFEGAALATPEVDTELTVVDRFQRCSYIKLADGKTGYVNPAYLGTEKEPERSDESDASSGYGYYYGDGYSGDYYYEEDGGGSGGGSQGWTGGSIDTGTGTGADGQDILITSLLLPAVPLAKVAYAFESSISQSSGKGTVLADNTKSYIAFLNRGDSVDMVIQSSSGSSDKNVAVDGKVHVLIDGQIGTVPSTLVRDSEAASYAVWTGYATADAKVYGDYVLLGVIKVCEINTQVTVLDEIESCYIVRVGELEGYMDKSQVSKTENEEADEEDSSSGGSGYYYGYYSGGSSVGTDVDAGNTGSAQSVIEAASNGGWTEEKL